MVEVTINCPTVIESIPYLVNICKSTFQLVRFPDTSIICFAIHESIINSVEATRQRYGEDYADGKTTLIVKACHQEVTVEIIDDAGGIPQTLLAKFDLENIPEQMEKILWSENGRGLLFIRHCVDEVSYQQTEDGRFSLCLRKRKKNQ